MNFRIIIIIGGLLFGSASLKAQSGNDITVPFSNPGQRGKVVVDIKLGPITVKGSGRQDVLVRYRNPEGDGVKLEEAGDGLKRISGGAVSLEILEHDNKVDIESSNWQKALEIYVEVPRGVDLELSTYNDGKIVVENIEGEVVVESYNGPITAENISGTLVADTYNGDIKVAFDRVTPDAPLAFTTYNGDVDVTFPANFRGSFKLRSERGEILTGFDMELSQPEVKQKETGKGWKKTFIDGWITGKVNGGGPEVTMKTYNGDIYIRKK